MKRKKNVKNYEKTKDNDSNFIDVTRDFKKKAKSVLVWLSYLILGDVYSSWGI